MNNQYSQSINSNQVINQNVNPGLNNQSTIQQFNPLGNNGQPMNNQYSQSINQNQAINQQVSAVDIDDELLKAYLGKNNGANNKQLYKKLKDKRKFIISWCGLFLGIPYIFYRKMFIEGLLVLLATVILNIFLPNGITIEIDVVLCAVFYPLYKRHVNKDIDKIKSQNPNASLEELKEKSSKKGGVSILSFIIAELIIVVFFIGVRLVFSAGTFGNEYMSMKYNKSVWDTVEKEDSDYCDGGAALVLNKNDNKGTFCKNSVISLTATSNFEQTMNSDELKKQLENNAVASFPGAEIIKHFTKEDGYYIMTLELQGDEYLRIYNIFADIDDTTYLAAYVAYTDSSDLSDKLFKESDKVINTLKMK